MTENGVSKVLGFVLSKPHKPYFVTPSPCGKAKGKRGEGGRNLWGTHARFLGFSVTKKVSTWFSKQKNILTLLFQKSKRNAMLMKTFFFGSC